MENQISSNIIISQSKISNISPKYHSIFKPWKESYSKQNIPKQNLMANPI